MHKHSQLSRAWPKRDGKIFPTIWIFYLRLEFLPLPLLTSKLTADSHGTYTRGTLDIGIKNKWASETMVPSWFPLVNHNVNQEWQFSYFSTGYLFRTETSCDLTTPGGTTCFLHLLQSKNHSLSSGIMGCSQSPPLVPEESVGTST